MPTYAYKCTQGHVYMEFRSILAEGTPKSNWICQVCQSEQSRFFDIGEKVIKYKGDGYYFQPGEVPPDGRPIIG
jgi:predicted nucleic acid-binding Zn ribbon protein